MSSQRLALLLLPLLALALLNGCEKAHTPPAPKMDAPAGEPQTRVPAPAAIQPETATKRP